MSSAPIETSRPKDQLQRNVAWLLIGSALFAASQYGAVVLIARGGSVEMLGQYALALAIVTPLILFANCALRTIQATDTRANLSFWDYLTFRTLGLAAASLVILAIASLYDDRTRAIIGGIALVKILESFGDLLHGVMQQYEQMHLIGQSQLLKAVLSLGCMGGTLWFTGSLLLAILASAGMFLLVLMLFDLPMTWRLWKSVLAEPLTSSAISDNRSWWRRQTELAQIALPMGLTVMLGALLVSIPRFAIERTSGAAELGIFAALSWLTLVGNLCASAVAHAILPKLSRCFASGQREEFRRVLDSLLLWGLIAGMAATTLASLWGPTVIQWTLGAEYAGHSSTLVALTVAMAAGLEICVLDHALYAARRFQVQVPLNVAACLAMLVGSWLIVPNYGLIGAAWVVATISIGQGIVRLVIVKRGLADIWPEPVLTKLMADSDASS